MYFLALYNIYVWTLTWGYWPGTDTKFRGLLDWSISHFYTVPTGPSENTLLSYVPFVKYADMIDSNPGMMLCKPYNVVIYGHKIVQ